MVFVWSSFNSIILHRKHSSQYDKLLLCFENFGRRNIVSGSLIILKMTTRSVFTCVQTSPAGAPLLWRQARPAEVALCYRFGELPARATERPHYICSIFLSSFMSDPSTASFLCHVYNKPLSLLVAHQFPSAVIPGPIGTLSAASNPRDENSNGFGELLRTLCSWVYAY